MLQAWKRRGIGAARRLREGVPAGSGPRREATGAAIWRWVVVSGPGFCAFLVGNRPVDLEAVWDGFLHEYTPLLLQVVRLHEHDADRVDDCFVFVCERLRCDGLARLRAFDPTGPASFGTWLRAVVRNLCIDWRRKRFGRPRPFRFVGRLAAVDQEVYRAFHLRGLTEAETLEAVRLRFPEVDRPTLADSLSRIERHLSPHQHWLLAVGRIREVSISTPSGDRDDAAPIDPPSTDPDPEEVAAHDEEICALREVVASLPADERLLLRLRYEQDLTLEEISSLTRIGSPVTVQRHLARATETLRALLEEKRRRSVSVQEGQREA